MHCMRSTVSPGPRRGTTCLHWSLLSLARLIQFPKGVFMVKGAAGDTILSERNENEAEHHSKAILAPIIGRQFVAHTHPVSLPVLHTIFL